MISDTIHIPNNILVRGEAAAGELKTFLNRASGVDFQIVTEDETDAGLFVGRTRLARE